MTTAIPSADDVLRALVTSPEQPDAHVLAAALGTPVQYLPPLLAALVDAGLIERVGVGYALSATGRERVAALLAREMRSPEQERDALVASWASAGHPVRRRGPRLPTGPALLAALQQPGIRDPETRGAALVAAAPALLAAAINGLVATATGPQTPSMALVASAGPSSPAAEWQASRGPNSALGRARRRDRLAALLGDDPTTGGSLVASADMAAADLPDGSVLSWSSAELNRQRRRARLRELLEGPR